MSNNADNGWKYPGWKWGALGLAVTFLAAVAGIVQSSDSSDDSAGADDPKSSATAPYSSQETPPLEPSSSPGTTESTPTASTVSKSPAIKFLSDMETVKDDHIETESRSINGIDFPHSVSFSVASCGIKEEPDFVEYQLSRKWRTFDATLGLDDDSMSGAEALLEVYVDGSLRVSYVAKVNTQKEVKSLDVSGAARLMLKQTFVDGPDGMCQIGYGTWGNAQLSE